MMNTVTSFMLIAILFVWPKDAEKIPPPMQERYTLKNMQGRWRLIQNKAQEILINGDSITYFYGGQKESRYQLRLSKSIKNRLFNSDSATITRMGYFVEELDPATAEVESQYSLISLDKRKMVLSPLSSNQLLSYNRIR